MHKTKSKSGMIARGYIRLRNTKITQNNINIRLRKERINPAKLPLTKKDMDFLDSFIKLSGFTPDKLDISGR